MRRRAVQEHRGLGSLPLVSSVAWGRASSLSLPQFPPRPSGGVNAAEFTELAGRLSSVVYVECSGPGV